MSETFFTDIEASIVENLPVEETDLHQDRREPLAQPNYCREKLMATDLVSVRSTVEYLRKNNELPFPHPSSKECAKAADVVASSIDFLRDCKETASPDQRTNIESIDQAVVAMQEVFGDPLEYTDDARIHPLVVFFNTLPVSSKEGTETMDVAAISPQSYGLIEQFVRRWEELEDERIVYANQLNRERWPREELNSSRG